jgi:glucose-1-phosphate cytidylyltransferase
LSNNFTLSEGGRKVELCSSDIQDWSITFVDTGLHANIGQRLQAVKEYLQDEEVFLANYSDGLTDVKLSDHIAHFHKHNKIASFLCVNPNLTYHFVLMHDNHLVHTMQDISRANIRINGGYFIFKKEIFNYIRDGEELVAEPFQRLIQEGELLGYQYDGFWAGMDTFKDKQMLEKLYESGHAPWEVWRNNHRDRQIHLVGSSL